MAIHGAFTSGTAWFSGYDLSGVANKLDFDAQAADLDTTVFTSAGAKTRTGGLVDTVASVDGYVEYGTGLEDDTLFGALAANTHVLTMTPTGADGATTYFTSILLDDYKTGGQVGTVLPFTASFKGRDQYGPLRGQLLLPKQVLPSGATNGTITQLGAVSATQRVYAVLHVFAVSGTSPTLDVVVKSAAAVGFSSPTTRITFAQQVAAGDVFAVPLGPGAITDQYWRVVATVGGSATPTVTAAVAVAIQ
jgi:hypothetical protein